MDLTDLLAATKDVNAAITQIDQKLRKPSSTAAPPVVEQATTDDAEELGDVAHVSSNGYVASCRCLAVARPSNSVELVDLDSGASTVLMEAPVAAAVAACDLPGNEVLVVAAWGDACARWRLARDGTGGWRVVRRYGHVPARRLQYGVKRRASSRRLLAIRHSAAPAR